MSVRLHGASPWHPNFCCLLYNIRTVLKSLSPLATRENLRKSPSIDVFLLLPRAIALTVVVGVSFPIVRLPGEVHGQGRNPDQQLTKAAELISNKQLLEAELQLSRILKARPNDAFALNLLGTVRAQQGRLAEAEKLFLTAVRIDVHFVGARLNLAYLYSLKKEPQNTALHLQAVLRENPGHSEAAVWLARLFLGQGEPERSIEILERTQATTGLTKPMLILLGDAYLRVNDAAKAEESFQQALGQQKDEADAVLGLAQAAQLRGDRDAALEHLSRARKLEAASPDTLFRFAQVAIRAGLFEEANTSLRAAIKIKDDEPTYFMELGNTWLMKPDLVEAEQAFRRAVELQPESPKAQMHLGYVLLEQKKFAEARQWLEQSLEKDKSVPETFYYLGLIFQEQNEDLRAIELFKKAIQLVPSYSFPHAALGASYLKLRNYALAREALELSVNLNPNDPKAHYSLAVLYARLKETEKAQKQMRIVEELRRARKPAQTEGDVASPLPKPR